MNSTPKMLLKFAPMLLKSSADCASVDNSEEFRFSDRSPHQRRTRREKLLSRSHRPEAASSHPEDGRPAEIRLPRQSERSDAVRAHPAIKGSCRILFPLLTPTLWGQRIAMWSVLIGIPPRRSQQMLRRLPHRGHRDTDRGHDDRVQGAITSRPSPCQATALAPATHAAAARSAPCAG